VFNWLRKKSRSYESPPTGQSERGGPLIAALLLDSPVFDTDAARQAIHSGEIAGISPSGVSVDRNILHLALNDEMLFVAPMGVPYPWSDLEGPCQTSWMWPPGTPAMSLKDHKSHVLVTAIKGTGDAISRRIVLTHLVGRLASVTGVVGIYWPEATLVHYPPIFAEMAAAASPKEPPLYLWVDFRVLREDDGTLTCFTTGLAPLGLMEMEITGLRMPPGELREWAVNIAAYMLDRGSPIPHGDTIGATAKEKLRITHGPSSFGAPDTVMRFGLSG
jgi:hypothetical protein